MDPEPNGLKRCFPARMSHSGLGTLALLGGSAGGQALALLSSPVVSRLYSPSHFGVFAVLSSAVAIVGTVSALRFDLAVPLPEHERDAHGLAALGFLSTGLTFMLTSMVVAVAGTRLASAFHQPDLMPWFWCVPVVSSAMGLYLTLNQLAIRHRRYGAIGRRSVLQSIAVVTTQISAGLASMKSCGLIMGLGAGQVASAISLVGGAGLFCDEARKGRERRHLRELVRRYRRFPLLLAPSGLLNVMGMQLPVVLIAYCYGTSVAGWMGLTQRVLSFPVMLLGAAVAQVYLAELAVAAREDVARVDRLFLQASKRLFLVAVAAAVTLLAAGPLLFGLVFGAGWETSGEFARALAVSLAAQLVASPISQTLIVFERQAIQLGWDAGRLAFTVGAVGMCCALGCRALVTIWVYGASSAVAYAVSWSLSFQTIRKARR